MGDHSIRDPRTGLTEDEAAALNAPATSAVPDDELADEGGVFAGEPAEFEPAPAPVEPKVTAATLAALVTAALVAGAGWLLDSGLLPLLPLPGWLLGILAVVLPAIAAGAAGYRAPHVERGQALPLADEDEHGGQVTP